MIASHSSVGISETGSPTLAPHGSHKAHGPMVKMGDLELVFARVPPPLGAYVSRCCLLARLRGGNIPAGDTCETHSMLACRSKGAAQGFDTKAVKANRAPTSFHPAALGLPLQMCRVSKSGSPLLVQCERQAEPWLYIWRGGGGGGNLYIYVYICMYTSTSTTEWATTRASHSRRLGPETTASQKANHQEQRTYVYLYIYTLQTLGLLLQKVSFLIQNPGTALGSP